MSYDNKILQRIEKYKQFYNDKTPGQILTLITPYTYNIDYPQISATPRKGGLNQWNFELEAKEYVENSVKHIKYFLDYTKDLDNDFIPNTSAHLGIGAHSAYFSGAEITFGEETSWSHPVIHTWEDMGQLKMDEENRWFKLIKEMTQYFVDFCDGSYVPGTFGHFAPADMANALRGNQLFYDFYDEPDKVHELMDISANAIIWLEKELKKIVGTVEGGTAAAGMWFPMNALFMSEDAPDLCSPDIYKEFCRSYTQKVIDNIGGAYIHHHAKGLHVHKEIAKLKGLETLEISWDPNCPRPIDNIVSIYEMNNGIPIKTRCTAEDVYNKIDELKQCRMVLMLNVKDLEEGREVMKFIRKHSKI